MEKILDRFLGYAQTYTQSDETTGLNPSTPQQMFFANDLVEELNRIGMQDVTISEYGYVMATLPANTNEPRPTIGFIAHMDTSPDMSGKHVKPRIVTNYDGGDITLNEQLGIYLKPSDFPEMEKYKGQDLIVTDGTTLLGADDKAGIAAIVTAMEYLLANPQIKHGKIRIAFTPDEEIGQGADNFDVAAFGADFAYTIDGGEVGELEYETFNAAAATITFHGRNVHPGSAYKKMRNSMRIASTFIYMIPRHDTPEHTQGYEGFYHLTDMKGDVETTTLHYIIRDHDRHRFEIRKTEMEHYVHRINAEYGEGTAEIEMKDQYYNMREKIEPVIHIVDLAKEAMKDCGIEPKVQPIRGGTDGARLSYMGLPTPNIFAGGLNFHGKYEFLPIQSMKKAMEVIVKICEKAKQD
ncbi:MAG: peptidase T [Bacteroidales bacterium]|nr:peptidase T [Bacteroidales bacterium]